MENYRKRIADVLLANKLAGKGAVLVEGPKWCGKTTTAEQIAKSVLYMADQDSLERNLQIADFKPSRLLEGARPRLLDEWQIAPKLWDTVRFAVDHTPGLGHFILTGSTVPDEKRDEIKHSGTGRISRMKMRPSAFQEVFQAQFSSARFGSTGSDEMKNRVSLVVFPVLLSYTTDSTMQTLRRPPLVGHCAGAGILLYFSPRTP